jgi:hypothetical protein
MLVDAAECEPLLSKDKQVLGEFADEGYWPLRWSSPDPAESFPPIISESGPGKDVGLRSAHRNTLGPNAG